MTTTITKSKSKEETSQCNHCCVTLRRGRGIVIVSIPSLSDHELHLCADCLISVWQGLTPEQKKLVMVLE